MPKVPYNRPPGFGEWQVVNPPFCEWIVIHYSPNPVHVMLVKGEALARVDQGNEFELFHMVVVELANLVEIHNILGSDKERNEAGEDSETEVWYKQLW